MTDTGGFGGGDERGRLSRPGGWRRPIDVESAVAAAMTRLRVAAAGRPGSSAARMIQADPGRTHRIHDLDGGVLFYDVDLVGAGAGTAGTLRLAAAEEVGTSLVSVETRVRRWDPDVALERAAVVAARLYPGAPVVDRTLVCYCYPKIGVRVELAAEAEAEPGASGTVLLLDASSLRPVDVAASVVEGSGAYSYYAEVVEPRIEGRLRRFAREQEHLDLVGRRAPELLDPATRVVDSRLVDRLAGDQRVPPPLTVEQVMPYAPRCSGHTCFELRAQQTDQYCAVAVGQMLLDWHRWYFTQDEIAAAMGTDPALGTTSNGQVRGIESLTTFDATLDESARWDEARAEIDAGRPLKDGIQGHARAVAGYQRTFNLATSAYDNGLRLYDPWPWNADICQGGAVYWEDFDVVDHKNWIYVRHP